MAIALKAFLLASSIGKAFFFSRSLVSCREVSLHFKQSGQITGSGTCTGSGTVVPDLVIVLET